MIIREKKVKITFKHQQQIVPCIKNVIGLVNTDNKKMTLELPTMTTCVQQLAKNTMYNTYIATRGTVGGVY